MACDTTSLVSSSKCFECLSMKQLEAINAYLLCQILAAGGGGGGTVQNGSGSPVGVLPPNAGSLYINNDDATLWAVANGAWYPLV